MPLAFATHLFTAKHKADTGRHIEGFRGRARSARTPTTSYTCRVGVPLGKISILAWVVDVLSDWALRLIVPAWRSWGRWVQTKGPPVLGRGCCCTGFVTVQSLNSKKYSKSACAGDFSRIPRSTTALQKEMLAEFRLQKGPDQASRSLTSNRTLATRSDQSRIDSDWKRNKAC